MSLTLFGNIAHELLDTLYSSISSLVSPLNLRGHKFNHGTKKSRKYWIYKRHLKLIEIDSEFKTKNFLLLYVKTYYKLPITQQNLPKHARQLKSPLKIKVGPGCYGTLTSYSSTTETFSLTTLQTVRINWQLINTILLNQTN